MLARVARQLRKTWYSGSPGVYCGGTKCQNEHPGELIIVSLREPLHSPAAWRGSTLEADSPWIYEPESQVIAGLAANRDQLHRSRRRLFDFRADGFPIPSFAAFGWKLQEQLEGGRGFTVKSSDCQSRAYLHAAPLRQATCVPGVPLHYNWNVNSQLVKQWGLPEVHLRNRSLLNTACGPQLCQHLFKPGGIPVTLHVTGRVSMES